MDWIVVKLLKKLGGREPVKEFVDRSLQPHFQRIVNKCIRKIAAMITAGRKLTGR